MAHRRLTEREQLALRSMGQAKLAGGEHQASVVEHCYLYLMARGWLPRPARYRARQEVKDLLGRKFQHGGKSRADGYAPAVAGGRRSLEELSTRVCEFLARRPDLLKPEYRISADAGLVHPLAGHCYVATEALYHMGAKDEGYRPHVLQVELGTHWFLKDSQGAILDPTAAQFPELPDYQAGRCCGFLTRQPSRRTRTVMAGIPLRSTKAEQHNPLLRRCMNQATWEQRVHGYLSNQAREYANTLRGLDRMQQLYKRRVAPRDAARRLERMAESLRG